MIFELESGHLAEAEGLLWHTDRRDFLSWWHKLFREVYVGVDACSFSEHTLQSA